MQQAKPETLLGRCQPRAACRVAVAGTGPAMQISSQKKDVLVQGNPLSPRKHLTLEPLLLPLPWGCILAGRGPVLQPSASAAQLAAPYVGSSGGPSLQSSLSWMLSGARSHRLPVSLEEAGVLLPSSRPGVPSPLSHGPGGLPFPIPPFISSLDSLAGCRTQERDD